jgi:hypothetical protein
MDTATLGTLIVAIVALIGAVGGIITARSSASGAITEAAMKLITPLTDRITLLENHEKRLDKLVKELIHGTHILTEQLKSKNIVPEWELDQKFLDEADL